MNIINNLFPPIINTYMPSFNVQQGVCRVYFSLSDFNSYAQVKNYVQVTVNDKNTNQSVLNPDLYPTGIKIVNEMQKDNTVETDMKYFIEISASDLKGGFKTNRFYKVQIRFTDSNIIDKPTQSSGLAGWLVDNQLYFSEWSSVCLIRGIETPQVTLRGFENNLQNKEIIFTSESLQLAGNISFINPSGENYEYAKEILVKVYRAYEDASNIKEYSIPIQQNMTASKSEFNYTFGESIEEGVPYIVDFKYITNGGYQSSGQYPFKIIQYGIDRINATIVATPDDQEGRMKLHIKALDSVKEEFMGKITIRRTSSESNFSYWEDIHHIVIKEAKELDYTWYDYTIKSGVWYKYCIQKRNRRNDRGIVVQTKEPVMATFEDSFLTQGGRQLKLKFDSSIGSFKYNILESKIDTLGSQYPFIRRNGNVKYRQFPITGLITSFCDEAGLFSTKENIYGSNTILYDKYNKENDISEYKDFSYEREFRERVIDFLYEDNIKLFKSPTEGNILIKLMDINFTPNQTLGRMLYSFSATAYEIENVSLEKFDKLNIQSIGELTGELITKVDEKLGKVIITNYDSSKNTFTLEDSLTSRDYKIVCPNDNIVSLINVLNANSGAIGFDNSIDTLKQVKLTFTSKPRLIKENKNNNPSITILPYDDKKTQIDENDNITLGYYIKVNDQDIIIKANPQYSRTRTLNKHNGLTNLIRYEYATFELNDLDINSLKIEGNPTVEITYIAENKQQETLSKLVDKVYYYKKIGQLNGIFKPEHSFVRDLFIKYTDRYKEVLKDNRYKEGYEELIAINGLAIEAPQGTLIYVKDSLDDHYNQHEINDTNYLNLENDFTTIDDCYFKGMRLTKGFFQENFLDLTKDRSDFVTHYPSVNENPYRHVKSSEYVNQYYQYQYVNSKIDIRKKVVEELPQEPVTNGVYMKGYRIGTTEEGAPIYDKYEYWIYYQDTWYLFDPVEEVVNCPVHALVNYYCETVEGEYEQ